MIFLKMYRDVGNLNPYALDYPVCTEDASTHRGLSKFGRTQRAWLLNHVHASMRENGKESETVAAIRKQIKLEPVSGYEPCEADYMTTYLNQASVKTALHVKSDVEWVDCSRTLRYQQSDGRNSMVPYYQYLIDGDFKLNILVYSGDDDDVCPTIGTQSWIWDMGYNVSGKSWQDYTVSGQVGGYLTKWANTKLAFATVHGAGHEVPTYKPDVALSLFKMYLNGELTDA
jgi:carboxypeptidase C (cathepsin A)